MKSNRLLSLILLLAIVLGVTAYATAGTAADPFISLSNLKKLYIDKVDSRLQAAQKESSTYTNSALEAGFNSQWERAEGQLNDLVMNRVYDKIAAKVSASSTLALSGYRKITLNKGEKLEGGLGTSYILTAGSGSLTGPSGADILDLTAGSVKKPGAAMVLKACYMLPANDKSGITATSATAEVYVKGTAKLVKPYEALHLKKAEMLKELTLFMGSDKGFELERAPTRQEALIMLIRLMGEEDAAVNYTGISPFTDLDNWAKGRKYIHYAFDKGYTKGTSNTTFAPSEESSLDMYLTFVLRALDYQDGKDKDFIWNKTSRTLAVSLGILTEADLKTIDSVGFMRDHVVLISYNAIGANPKNSYETLGDRLVSKGVITESALYAWKVHIG